MIIFGTVSKVDYAKARVDVAVADQEDMILKDIPYFTWMYAMPKKKDYVVIISEDKSTDKFSHMVCLGTPYSDKRKPKKNGKDVVYIEFPDGTYVHYDPKEKKIETNAKKVKAKSIDADDITATDWIKAKTVTVSGALSAGSVSVSGALTASSVTASTIVYHSSCSKG